VSLKVPHKNVIDTPMQRLPKQEPQHKQKSNWRQALDRLEGAYADGTLRAYRADMEAFESWCKKAKRAAIPARPETLAAFVAHQSELVAPSTLKRRLAAIRKIHRLMKLENPATDEEVLIAMRRALRKKPTRPRQALALTSSFRNRLIAACPESLLGKRDRALIALGYDTLCRRAELAALQVEDIVGSDNQTVQILIRRSKSDPYGRGRLGYVSPDTRQLLNVWLGAAKIEEGFIFRTVRRGSVGRQPLHPSSINRILKRNAAAAKLNPKEIEAISGHSMRVGAAQDMIVSGLSILPIMQAGGWKCVNVVSRYVENANLTCLLERARAAADRRLKKERMSS
jgi:integrase/recombinase XerD